MPRRGGRHYVLVKGAEEAMEAFKREIAEDLGLADLIDEDGSYKNLTTVQVGQIGGEITRRIMAAGQWAIKERYEAGQERLLPKEVLPDENLIREVTNNGNPAVTKTKDPSYAPHSGQQSTSDQMQH